MIVLLINLLACAALSEATAFPDDGAKVCTIINPMVNGEPLIPEKTYRLAFCGSPSETENPEPVISTMEEAAAAMGEYLKSGKAVILPDVPVPDGRIVPMDEIPSGAVVYEIAPENMLTS